MLPHGRQETRKEDYPRCRRRKSKKMQERTKSCTTAHGVHKTGNCICVHTPQSPLLVQIYMPPCMLITTYHYQNVIFSRVHATLQPTLSVCRSVGPSVTLRFFFVVLHHITAFAHLHVTKVDVYPALLLPLSHFARWTTWRPRIFLK